MIQSFQTQKLAGFNRSTVLRVLRQMVIVPGGLPQYVQFFLAKDRMLQKSGNVTENTALLIQTARATQSKSLARGGGSAEHDSRGGLWGLMRVQEQPHYKPLFDKTETISTPTVLRRAVFNAHCVSPRGQGTALSLSCCFAIETSYG